MKTLCILIHLSIKNIKSWSMNDKEKSHSHHMSAFHSLSPYISTFYLHFLRHIITYLFSLNIKLGEFNWQYLTTNVKIFMRPLHLIKTSIGIEHYLLWLSTMKVVFISIYIHILLQLQLPLLKVISFGTQQL